MYEKQHETLIKAQYLWEYGMLRFCYDKGIITAEEYNGICQIIEKEMYQEIYSK